MQGLDFISFMLSLGIQTSVMLYCHKCFWTKLWTNPYYYNRLLLFRRYSGNLDHFKVKQHKCIMWTLARGQRSLKACMRSFQNHKESHLLFAINIMPVYHLLSKFVLASAMRGGITERPPWALTGRCIQKNPLILIRFTGTFFIFNIASCS